MYYHQFVCTGDALSEVAAAQLGCASAAVQLDSPSFTLAAYAAPLIYEITGAVMSSSSHPSGPNIVGNYYRVGRKIGEGMSSLTTKPTKNLG